MSEYKTAHCFADFNEAEFKKFASRIGDRWSFTLPASEMNELDNLLVGYVLSVEKIVMGPGAEIMLGKLKRRES